LSYVGFFYRKRDACPFTISGTYCIFFTIFAKDSQILYDKR